MMHHTPTQHPPGVVAPGVVASASHAHRTPRAVTTRASTKDFRGGFTLIELLVVISIIALVMLATFPVLSAMKSGSREAAGYNTVAVAASAARQLATSQKAKFDPLTDGQPFAGTAALFTNTGDIRIVEHDSDLTINNGTGDELGYDDVSDRDYIRIPQRVGIVGISTGGEPPFTTFDLKLIAPPFAIRFNSYGGLVFGKDNGSQEERLVFYDGNGAGSADASRTRTSVSPQPYDPNNANHKQWLTDRYEVPFDRIETVVGVIVYEDEGDIDLTAEASGYLPQSTEDAILSKGKAVFFSRYTGAPLRTGFE